MDGSVFVTDAATGVSRRVTPRSKAKAEAPRPEACVFSPDGRRIAYVRPVKDGTGWHNQIFVVMLDKATGS
jgi:Tol biopolymer transport system component